jgi:hypothetical protein
MSGFPDRGLGDVKAGDEVSVMHNGRLRSIVTVHSTTATRIRTEKTNGSGLVVWNRKTGYRVPRERGDCESSIAPVKQKHRDTLEAARLRLAIPPLLEKANLVELMVAFVALSRRVP